MPGLSLMGWTAEEKRERRSAKRAARDAANAAAGIVPQPAHRPPAGKVWDAHAGCWVASEAAGPEELGQPASKRKKQDASARRTAQRLLNEA